MLAYRCPECLLDLTSGASVLYCGRCQKEYSIVDGVALLCRSQDTYYGEVTRDSMRHIVSRAKEVGYRQALLEHSDTVGDTEFMRYAIGEARAAFKFLLTGFGAARVLDYGSGPGAITASLARNFGAVYATDLTPERAAFTRIRADQDGLTNVSVFCCGDTSHIPLPDGAVDIVVLNGVLEWLPEFRAGEPRTVQLEFLKELRRILTSSGLLFVGIENRIGFGYFLGKREHHTRLRFGALLPRWAANVYSRVVRGKPFRPRTYSRMGYCSLLREAGFADVDFWGCIPDYRNIERAVHLSDKPMLEWCLTGDGWKRRARNTIIRTLLPLMSDSFAILAGKSDPFVFRLVRHVSGLCGEKLELLRYGVTGGGAVHLLLAGKARYILKLPMSPIAERRLADGSENARRIKAYVPSTPVALPATWSRFEGQAFLCEPMLLGTPSADPEVVWPFLAELCRSSRTPVRTWGTALATVARRYAEPLLGEFRARGLRCCDPGPRVEMLLQNLSQIDRDGGFHCAIHGDFWSPNILSRDGQITGILDADRFEADALPFLDLFHFLVKRHSDFGSGVLEVLREKPSAVHRYGESVGVDPALAPDFLAVYWLRQSLFVLRDDLPQNPAVLHATICRPLEQFSSRQPCLNIGIGRL